MMYDVFKRLLDLSAAAIALVLLSPLMIIVGLAVRLFLGSPVMFVQERPGLQGRPFHLVKFRTMRNARDASGALLPDADRLGKFGRFLRRTSLDELPQLINVIRGDLSLVGPRPLLTQYLPLYSAEQRRRHDVKPGITGLAQVSGRNSISWQEKLALDVWYVDHRSMTLDLKIILRTVGKVFRGSDVEGRGNVPFAGNEDH